MKAKKPDSKSSAKAETKLRPPNSDSASENRQVELPDTDTLSLLAAQWRFSGTTDNKTAVSAALALWREAKTSLDRERKKRPFNRWENCYGVNIPRPPQFPVSFEEMLRHLMPQVEKGADRVARFRNHLADTPIVESDGKPTGRTSGKEQASQKIGELKQRKIYEEEYWIRGQCFLRWWKEKLSSERSKFGAAGGRSKKSD